MLSIITISMYCNYATVYMQFYYFNYYISIARHQMLWFNFTNYAMLQYSHY